MITLLPYNATHIRVRCDDWGVEQELVEHFTFDVPGAKFSPKYRSGIWDGKIKLFSTRNKLIYRGLIELLYKFAKSRGYPIEIDTALNPSIKVTREEVSEFMHGLQLVGRGVPIEIRDYQITAVHKALSNKRLILESATSSGKSLIIYSIIRYALIHDKQLVLIVPTVNLVNQMVDDFKDYSTVNGWDADEHVHKLYAGKERVFNKPVIVSTWQTLASMKKSDPSNYQALTANTDILIADECLHPDTEISMGDGSIKKISDILIGDLVKTKNEKTGVMEDKPVLKLHRNISTKQKKYKIKTKSGKEVIITGNHKMMTQRGWVRADELTKWDSIIYE